MTSAPVTPMKPLAPLPRALLAFLPVFAAALLGNIATTPNIPTWYAGLEKPFFTPPNWLFGPVWIFLYSLMLNAVWAILSKPPATPGRKIALTAFFTQLALNASWSFAFFAARSPLLGLIVIVLLLAAILWTIRAFWRVDRIAAWCLIPYVLWVGYATALNGAIWWLNG